MKSIALINFYFAERIPRYMDFYLASVGNNTSIDLYLFTNLDIQTKYKNIIIVRIELKDFTNIIEKSITSILRKNGIYDEVKINSAYKIADFRPTFGFCLQEYIKDYDFWGGCDLDLVFGDIRKYIPDEVLENNDKIFEHGHFFLIRNNDECNTAFLDDYENRFKGVLELEKNSFFEEVYEKPWLPHGGINSIFKERGRLYTNRQALCDISFKYGNLIDLKNPSGSKQNIFEFNRGKLFRYSLIDKDEIGKEEVFYAHFQKRMLNAHTDNYNMFLVGNHAFEPHEPITVSSFRYTEKRNIITYKYIKFTYFDAITRKLNGDFKWGNKKC